LAYLYDKPIVAGSTKQPDVSIIALVINTTDYYFTDARRLSGAWVEDYTVV
jgi:hypothetical protein